MAQQEIDLIIHSFRRRFLRGFADALGLSYYEYVESMGWNEPARREQADREGAGRLARARRLITIAARTKKRGPLIRKMKRIRRLHRDVYGPHYAETRISIPLMFARTSRSLQIFTMALSRNVESWAKLAARGPRMSSFFDVARLGEAYDPTMLCDTCGLPIPDCNRKAQLRRDGERFRRFQKRVTAIQEEAAVQPDVRRALNDGVLADVGTVVAPVVIGARQQGKTAAMERLGRKPVVAPPRNRA